MKGLFLLAALFVSPAGVWAQGPAAPSLNGMVTDPSGAAIPGATVQLQGSRSERRTKTDLAGRYSFPSLPTGKYQIRILAKGFSMVEKRGLLIDQPVIWNAQLTIQGEPQAITVQSDVGGVTTDPASNGSAVVLRQKQLAALSDDPDELMQQLQALAGPSPGPGGGQIYIDGFLGGNLPPKSAIREVRINLNPFSPEYDRPGFGRVEIFTKPGADPIRGQVFAQYNNQLLNSRNPLLTQPTRAPFQVQFYGFDISGPLKRNKSSFTLNVEQRNERENAFVLATTLDHDLNPSTINQALTTPQSRTTVTPRIDYTINPKNTLAARYQEVRVGLDNQGTGDFELASRAYNQRRTERTAQITETAMISPQAIIETRFQYMRFGVRNISDNGTPAIDVRGAFSVGGPPIGNSTTTTNSWELTNASIWTRGTHTIKWGGRVRESLLSDTSFANFAGTFTFFTLDRFRETLALQRAGYTGAQIAQLGAGPSQFSLNAGTPTTKVNQTDVGLWVNDDWRARPNLTMSIGLRYEAQTNAGRLHDWAPRLSIAWGLDGKSSHPAKTVLRAGFGTFYDRIPNTVTLNALRYNGTSQQSYLIRNPTFFPEIPPLSALQANQQPQQLQPVYSAIQSPRIYQTSAGLERQFNQQARMTVTYIHSRGVHLLNSRNINAPINGVFPFADRGIRLLTESNGRSRLNQLVVSPNVNYRGLVLFGFYSLSYGMDDASYGMNISNPLPPADPYNLRAEWGPSTYGDVRHRLMLATSISLPWRLSIMPFVICEQRSGI